MHLNTVTVVAFSQPQEYSLWNKSLFKVNVMPCVSLGQSVISSNVSKTTPPLIQYIVSAVFSL